MRVTKGTHEYAYEVKLAATVRVKAGTKAEALRKIQGLSWIDFKGEWADAKCGDSTIANACVDDCSPTLVEVDGKEI